MIISMSIFGFDHPTLTAMQALADHTEAIQTQIKWAEDAQRYIDHPTLTAMQALADHTEAIQTQIKWAEDAQRYIDHPTLTAMQALADHTEAIQTQIKWAEDAQRYIDHPTLTAMQALADHTEAIQTQIKWAEDAQRYIDHPTLTAMQALADHTEAIQTQIKWAEDAQRYIDHPTLTAMQGALQTLSTRRLFEGLGPGKDEVHDPVPELPAAGSEDASNVAADPATETPEVLETLVELATWIDLAALLGQLREAGLDSWDAGWLAVARQIDECLGWLMVTASTDEVCWSCGEPALPRSGVTCSECVVLLGEMVLEMRLLVEGLEPGHD